MDGLVSERLVRFCNLRFIILTILIALIIPIGAYFYSKLHNAITSHLGVQIPFNKLFGHQLNTSDIAWGEILHSLSL